MVAMLFSIAIFSIIGKFVKIFSYIEERYEAGEAEFISYRYEIY